MNVEQSLGNVAGGWAGTNLKRMTPDDEYKRSAAAATVSVVAQGNAASLAYTWAEEGAPQEGFLLMTNGEQSASVAAVWVDSWHSSPQWMELAGTVDDGGLIRLEGAYAGGRWRITLDPTGGDHLRLAMDNIYQGMDYQAVEATYRRAG